MEINTACPIFSEGAIREQNMKDLGTYFKHLRFFPNGIERILLK